MIFTAATAIALFIFTSAASGIVGQAAYDAIKNLYYKKWNRDIISLYIKAFHKSLDSWEPFLTRIAEQKAPFSFDEKRIYEFFTQPTLEIPSISTITSAELAQALANNFENYLFIPGHRLAKSELRDLALRIIRNSAELFVEEISRDQNAFRMIVLQESRLATYDREVIIELLKKMPIAMNAQIVNIDNKLDQVMMKIDRVIDAVERQTQLNFQTMEDFRKVCEESVLRSISSISKYNKRLYVSRSIVEWEFSEFLKSRKTCLLLKSEAGLGKTNLLCHLASKYSIQMPTIFFRGTTNMDGHLGLFRVIADELSALNKISIDPAQVIYILNDFLESNQANMIIFIDAINENRNIPGIKDSLGYAIKDLAKTRIKLCISCRDIDWRLFEDDERITLHMYEPKRCTDRITNAVIVEPFSEQELKKAWTKYSSYYHIQGELLPALELICRHPLMLQLLCDAFQGKRIPLGIHRKEIFDRYWKEKVDVNRTYSLETTIYTLVEEMFQRREIELNENYAIKLIGVENYNKLLSEQVIIYTYLDPILNQNIIGFTYEAFLEYVLARYLRQSWNWIRSNNENIYNNLESLIALADQYRIIQGVMQYLILFLSDSPVASKLLLELTKLDDRWKIFFCDIQIKIDNEQVHKTILPRLIQLSQEESPQVRWAVGNAFGLIALSQKLPKEEYLEKLIYSDDWKKREVAAFAVRHNRLELSETIQTLELLADDINWRVRRATGYSLNYLYTSYPNVGFDVINNWSKSTNWRKRWAVVKSLKGLPISIMKTIPLLKELTRDLSPDVRWLTIIDLVTLARYQEAQSEVIILLSAMTEDANDWVRKHLATWVPDLYNSIKEESLPIVNKLATDKNKSVRWELARSLDRISSSKMAQRVIEILVKDSDKDVSFASAFTRKDMGKQEQTPYEDVTELERMRQLRENVARSSNILRVLKDSSDLFNTWKGDRYTNVLDTVNQETTLLAESENILIFFELLLADEDEGIRWALASVLSISGLLTVDMKLNLLTRLISDSHYWVRREAISSLFKMIVNQKCKVDELELKGFDITILEQRCFDENPEVRFAALTSLLGLRGKYNSQLDIISIASLDVDRQIKKLVVK